METGKISYCKIFPPVGVARVGESEAEDGFFFPPELPGQSASGPGDAPGANFKYRDQAGKIRRQAARFRLYAFDREHKPLGELTAELADIVWQVELANKKSAWFEFAGAHGALSAFAAEDPPKDVSGAPLRPRNPDIGKIEIEEGAGPHGRRYRSSVQRAKLLEIHGGQRSVSGANRRHDPANPDAEKRQLLDFSGTFMGAASVYLGELRTDHAGRLIVLGGRGKSDAIDKNGTSIRKSRWITHYANNNDWHDDTSDGPVRASVRLKGSDKPLEVRGSAWVVVAPPDFAPDVSNIVTLHDVFEEVAVNNPALVNELSLQPRPADVAEFERDVFPMLRSVDGYRWVSLLGLRGHGFGRPGDFLAPDGHHAGAQLRAEGAAGMALRQHILSVIRKPSYEIPDQPQPAGDPAQATEYFMPPLSGDEGTTEDGNLSTWLTVTYLQYARLERWAAGTLLPHTPLPPEHLADGSPDPFLLTQTLMNRCCGGAFYPGIEITSIIRNHQLYAEAGRFDGDRLEAGDVTKYMACPWQADFFECNTNWWPAQRPDEVIHEAAFAEIFASFPAEETGDLHNTLERLLGSRLAWARGVGDLMPRPSHDFLVNALWPTDHAPGQKLAEYATARVEAWVKLLLEGKPQEDGASPWRLQYILQEYLDTFSGRYYHLLAPDPEAAFGRRKLAEVASKIDARWRNSDWRALRSLWRDAQASGDEAIIDELDAISAHYMKVLREKLREQLRKIVTEHPVFDSDAPPEGGDAIKAFVDAIGNESVSGLDSEHWEEIREGSAAYRRYALAELRSALLDRAYQRYNEQSGDNAMVDAWRNLGFVVRRHMKVTADKGITVHVETERSRYDGISFRDQFYFLLNLQEHPEFKEYGTKIAGDALARAQELIDSHTIRDQQHPESYVPYDVVLFNAKMDEVYEILRNQHQDYDLYDNLRRSNRESAVQRIVGNAPFNQLDGSWLRHIAAAGPSDEVNGLLFEIWSDEIGNGDAALHHANLYTALLESSNVYLPEIPTRVYADDARLTESQFVSPVFQLAISQDSETFLPELLGMTLFLEWEVLSLTPGIDLLDYLGIDTQFWRMHVGIDNASEGHGAKAKKAIEIYLDKIAAQGGDSAVQDHWKRIWRGYVAFAAPFSGVFANDREDDDSVAARRPGNAAERLSQVIARKQRFGSLNHGSKRIGGHRLNDLFGNPSLFMSMLANSKWVVPGQPAASQLLTLLTTFQGPMYKVFDSNDLGVWRDWIEWLGREGDTQVVKRYLDKGEAMQLLLEALRSEAESVAAHGRFKIDVPGAPPSGPRKLSVAQYFARGNMIDLMFALAAPDNGWVVPGLVEQSPLVADMARGGRPMGLALDKRFPRAADRIGRQILIEWIRAGCSIPGQAAPGRARFIAHAKPRRRRLLMQLFGMGAVH